MNEKQAREIYKPFEAYKTFPIAFMKVGDVDYAQILETKGYLEALDKAKGLEEALIAITQPCECNPSGPCECDQQCAKEALAKYRSEK